MGVSWEGGIGEERGEDGVSCEGRGGGGGMEGGLQVGRTMRRTFNVMFIGSISQPEADGSRDKIA